MNQIDTIAKEIDDLYREVSSRSWVQYTTGFDLGVSEAKAKVKDQLKNPEKYKIALAAHESKLDPIEQRKAKILHDQFKDFHLSDDVKRIKDELDELTNSLMTVVNKFRSEIDGKEMSGTEIGKILDQSPDRELRKKAYESRLPLNQQLVDAGFIKLINLRKELAHACGFKNYVEYSLERSGMSAELFKLWHAECAQRAEKYQAKSHQLAQEYLGVEKIMPWDQNYLKAQVCSLNDTQVDMTNFYDLIAKTFKKFDFDITKMNLTYDIFPRKNKSEWGYHFSIETGKDSRILANVSNRFSDYNVLMHETAHGVHYMGLNPDEILLNIGVSGILAEGFANFFGSQCFSREFLSEIFKENTEEAFQAFKKLNTVEHFQNYRIVADLFFDHELYYTDVKNADDIQKLRQSVGKEVLGEEGYEVPWAKLIHHTSHPIYLHNYLLGDVMSENMRVEFSKRYPGKMAEDCPKEFGQFWKTEMLSPSGRDPFLELYKKVFKKDLSLAEYVDSKCLS